MNWRAITFGLPLARARSQKIWTVVQRHDNVVYLELTDGWLSGLKQRS
ncbi:MAG: hypothetical protein HW380_3676 [Magnetococcales bacterium]|nr:hypothetical protein [Magnetococcales bacterium]